MTEPTKEHVRLPKNTQQAHYANTPMQYTTIFHGCKNENVQMKNCNIFLIFAQKIDCEAVLTRTHNLCFRAKIEMYTPLNPSLQYKSGV